MDRGGAYVYFSIGGIKLFTVELWGGTQFDQYYISLWIWVTPAGSTL